MQSKALGDSIPTYSRTISTNSSKNQLYHAKDKSSNVWYSLVYGSNNIDDWLNVSERDGKENIQDPRSDVQKRSMFNFFPQRKDQTKGLTGKAAMTAEHSNDTPPPQEIYGDIEKITSHPTSSETPSATNHRGIPIHFNDYVSQLVGRALSRYPGSGKKWRTTERSHQCV